MSQPRTYTPAIAPWILVLAAVLTGCQSSDLGESGYLTDYSKLQEAEPGRLIFVDTVNLPDLRQIIVAPLKWRFYDPANAARVSEEDREHATSMLEQALLEKLSPHYDTTIFAGRGRWALRCAITDFGRSAELQRLPSGSVFGTLTIEAEIIDPFTHDQMFAVVRDIPGVELPPDEAGWQRFAARIDEWTNSMLATLGH